MRYIYLSKEIAEHELKNTLDLFGEDGFELVTVSLIPRMKQRMTPTGLQQAMDINYLLIFKKCQE
jgi:hypothetical protein